MWPHPPAVLCPSGSTNEPSMKTTEVHVGFHPLFLQDADHFIGGHQSFTEVFLDPLLGHNLLETMHAQTSIFKFKTVTWNTSFTENSHVPRKEGCTVKPAGQTRQVLRLFLYQVLDLGWVYDFLSNPWGIRFSLLAPVSLLFLRPPESWPSDSFCSEIPSRSFMWNTSLPAPSSPCLCTFSRALSQVSGFFLPTHFCPINAVLFSQLYAAKCPTSNLPAFSRDLPCLPAFLKCPPPPPSTSLHTSLWISISSLSSGIFSLKNYF